MEEMGNRLGKNTRGPSMLYSANSVVEEVQSRHASLLAKHQEAGVTWSSVTERTEDHGWEEWMRDEYDVG